MEFAIEEAQRVNGAVVLKALVIRAEPVGHFVVGTQVRSHQLDDFRPTQGARFDVRRFGAATVEQPLRRMQEPTLEHANPAEVAWQLRSVFLASDDLRTTQAFRNPFEVEQRAAVLAHPGL